MVNLVEALKELIGITTNTYDFLIVEFCLILVAIVFYYMSLVVYSLLKWVGGVR